MASHTVLVLLASLCAFYSLPQQALTTVAASSPPNFVFILADDLGYGEISAMPGRTNTNITTPAIDSLLASGMTFTNAYCGEAVCAPSRGSLMTGRHTGHAYIRGNHHGPEGHDLPLRANDTTFLQVLQKHGYYVGCVGKWGLGWMDNSGAPNLKGCDEYFGVLDQAYAHNMYPHLANYTWQYPDRQGRPQWESISYPQNANASRERCMAPAPGNDCVWSHELWTTAALRFIEARSGKDQPFFLYLAYTDPHAGGWTGTREQGNPVPGDGKFADETSWPEAERDHASVIVNYQDVDVGKVVSALDKHGLRDSTAVFYASDNGASNEGDHNYEFFGSSGPLRGFKRCLTEGGIRTPFGASMPGTIPSGVTSEYTVAFWDMFPTFAELAGVPSSSLPKDLDGVSVAPLLLGREDKQPVHPPLYWEFCTSVHPPGVTRKGPGWAHAVRNGTWKAVSFFKDQPFFLYDLSTDVGEQHDVADQHPDIVQELETFAKAAHTPSELFPVDGCQPSL